MRMLARPAIAGAAAWLLFGLGGAGCDGIAPARSIQPLWPSPKPDSSSPAGVLRLLEWCYNNKSRATCRELFTEDFRWFCSPLDSTGAAWRDTLWTREDELISTTHLFVGGSVDQPPAGTIRLSFDRNFLVTPDPFYTHFMDGTLRDPTGTWHRTIRTSVALWILTDDGSNLELRGHSTFYFVRGDSALIPEELRQRGFGPDPGRWYIRRWDDDTFQDEGSAQKVAAVATPHAALSSLPATRVSWCRLKALYR